MELKFMVWDSTNKIMCVAYHLEWSGGIVWAHGLPHYKNNTRRILNTNANPIFMFIGRLDKRAQEIYTGHKINWNKEEWVVIFELGCFWLSTESRMSPLYEIASSELEIIGHTMTDKEKPTAHKTEPFA